jgi:hypothetical protein
MNPGAVMMWFLVIAAVITPGQDQAVVQRDISIYMPGSGTAEGWKEIGPSRVFVGEGLYDLINGGAVIYFEYGFKQAVTQEYENIDGHSIVLQIYEMTDPSSAFGVYTFLRGAEGKNFDIGDEGVIEDHYLYFWKGNFLITLIASDSEEGVSSAMWALAHEVDRRIMRTGERPSLCNLLKLEGEAPLRIYYIEGALALSSLYYFSADDVFGITQGVVGDFDDYKLFIFKYRDEKESIHQYTTARNELKEDERFGNFSDRNNECSMEDEQGSLIELKVHQSYIFAYLGTSDRDPDTIFYKVENNLR